MATLSRLFIHPVKSMAGMSVSHALTDISGLALDRIFMITETDGTFYYHPSVCANGEIYAITVARRSALNGPRW